MFADPDRTVQRADNDRYRQALTELGGEATLDQIVERAGTGEADRYYIASCLIAPEPTRADPSIVFPFAVPAAWKPSVWRTEAHWIAEDLEDGVRYLGTGEEDG